MVRLLALLVPLAGLLAVAPAPRRPVPAPVKLLVVVYFDQMRGDYLTRWGHLFGSGGFHRLTADGASFTDCQYPYATTTTGPGHAAVLAGCGGADHGIINNNWFDRAGGEEVYCAASGRYQFVPPPVTPKAVAEAKPDAKRKTPKQAGNPDRFLGETVADRVTAAGGRVVGVSLKDRSAVFPAGRRPAGAYWFDGLFHTSTYYRDALPGWVRAFNDSKAADRWLGRPWERLRADVSYDREAGPDDGPGEGTGKRQGRTFPHPTGDPAAGPDQLYYEALANSPFGNELLLDFAKACLAGEKLGTRDRPDLLTVSFSSNDLIGHAWGPDSHEVLDVTLRSDRLMADFLAHLDATVGAGQYAVILTADHGVCPTPEATGGRGKRVPPKPLVLAAERFLQQTFGNPGGAGGERDLWLEKLSPPHAYLNHRLLAAKGLDPATVADKLARWLETQPGIQKAFTRAEVLATDAPADRLREQVRMSFHPDRAGDVVVVTKPYHLLDDVGTGTSHGTPHRYDTWVPLVVLAPGVTGGPRPEPVTPLHAAAVAGKLLGVGPPAGAKYPVPAGLFGR